ncbi:Lipid phosphate phosphatase 1 [Galdieria sulphuraria]|nr:Lipid phosphate phosphatase 1 [Galdieria sulphuraria]
MSSSSSLGICSSRYSGKQALTYLKDAYLIDWFTLGVFGVIFPFILKTSVHPYRYFGVIVEWRWVRRTKRWIPAIFNLHIFILGLLEATLCTVTITEILKLVAGRPRPYFLSVCEPINGSTINCQGNAAQIEEARKSFPSGHTSLAFAAAVYLTLYFIKIFWLSEGFYRVSRTMDYHHHFSDIVAGAWLGTVTRK